MVCCARAFLVGGERVAWPFGRRPLRARRGKKGRLKVGKRFEKSGWVLMGVEGAGSGEECVKIQVEGRRAEFGLVAGGGRWTGGRG